jgi:hypothetical protein
MVLVSCYHGKKQKLELSLKISSGGKSYQPKLDVEKILMQNWEKKQIQTFDFDHADLK